MQSLAAGNKVVYGIDPDSERFGVSVYYNGSLIELKQFTAPELIFDINEYDETTKKLVSIENVMANQFVYARNSTQTKQRKVKLQCT